MVEYLNYASLSNRASLKVLHAVLARHVDCLILRHWVDHLLRFLLLRLSAAHALIGLHDINLIAYQDLDGNLACTLALCDPLFDALEGRPLRHIKEVNNRSGAIHVLVHVLVVSLLARHVEVYDFVLVGIINIKSSLMKEEK